jgi:phosphohistidine phosphatase SixA
MKKLKINFIKNIYYGPQFIFKYPLLILMLQACIYEKMPEIIPKLEITGLPDSLIVAPSSVNQYLAKPIANWSINDPKGGNVDSTGKYNSGNTEGVFTLTAVNAKNKLDTLKRSVIVLKDADLFKDIKKGGYIFSFRHAAASVGSDQTSSKVPEWWKSCESTMARQITLPIGKNQSDSTGKVIKFLKIPVDTTITSEFCRCKQTTEYFNLGVPNKTIKDLTFFVYDETNRYESTMKYFASRPITTKNYIVVGHAGYGKTPTPAPLATLEWGDAAIFKQISIGTEPKFIKTIRVKEWTNLAKILK